METAESYIHEQLTRCSQLLSKLSQIINSLNDIDANIANQFAQSIAPRIDAIESTIGTIEHKDLLIVMNESDHALYVLDAGHERSHIDAANEWVERFKHQSTKLMIEESDGIHDDHPIYYVIRILK